MQNITVKHRARHYCELPEEVRILAELRSHGTKFQKLRKSIEKYTTVAKSEAARRYFRSSAEFAKERKRHLRDSRHRFMIHPFSDFQRNQAKFMSVVWFVTAATQSFTGTFLAKELLTRRFPALLIIMYGLNLVFFCDVFLRMMTGYTIDKTRTVILDRTLTRKHYLKTYFLVDVLPCVGYMVFYHGVNLNRWTQLLFYNFHNLRFIRMKTFTDNVDKVLIHLRIDETVRRLVEVVLIAVITVHFFTCLSGFYIVIHKVLQIPYSKHSWYMEAKMERVQHEVHRARKAHLAEHIFYLYYLHCGVICTHFFGLQSARYHTTDEYEICLLTTVLLLGLPYYIYFMARISQLVGVLNMSDSKYDELLLKAEDYMMKKKFHTALKSRVSSYYDYKFNKKYFHEESILGTLSEHLQMEVLLYSCQNLISKVHLFKGLSRSAVGCLLSMMKQDIFVPNDEILAHGDTAKSIYFILYGTCGIDLPSGKEVMHIEDGDHFGTLQCFDYTAGTTGAYSVTALEMVQVYRLDEEDIAYCVKNFPEVQSKLEVMERNRMKRYSFLFRVRGEDEDVTEDIINELRKGRILWHGITRSHFV